MTLDTRANLAAVITNARLRRLIYSAFILAGIVVGAIQVAYANIPGDDPAWIGVALAVLVYLSIPVGSLALVNVTASTRVTMTNGTDPAVAYPPTTATDGGRRG